jgi:hypothetical protein
LQQVIDQVSGALAGVYGCHLYDRVEVEVYKDP